MTRHERAKLQTVAAEVAGRVQAASNGRTVTSAVVGALKAEHSVLIAEYSDALLDAALSAMVNKCFKRANKKEAAELQTTLFANSEPGLPIPKSIALPSKGGSREVTWIRLDRASLSEIDGNIEMLAKGIAADQVKHKQLLAVRARIADLTGGDDVDTPIGDLLSGLRTVVRRRKRK